ncbi:MAG: aminopeptidase P family protein [Proteobacteria bacterium]|nr:aminopeptidase P family protein [Pseudomonadota bacterium]
MARHELDALLLASADFFEFATNHGVTVQAWERPFALVLTRAGAAVAVMPEISANKLAAERQRGALWLDRTVHYVERPLAGRASTEDFPAALADLLRELGLTRARIGIDGAAGPVARALALRPEATTVAVVADLRTVRLVKHAEEIAAFRQAAALADWALARYRAELRPGRLTQEVDHLIAAATMVEAAARVPDEDFQILKFMTLSGPAGASPHGDGAQTGARVLAGAPAVVACNVRLNGLSVEDQRTFACGQPGADVIRLIDAARHATEAGLAAAVAGAPLSGIDQTACGVIERAGFGRYILHRTGHGIGVATHEFPEDMGFNPRPLIADEVMVVEPGIYVPGLGGFRYVDMAVVGATPDRLTHAPSDLAAMTIA